jgi:hypothetical protein
MTSPGYSAFCQAPTYPKWLLQILSPVWFVWLLVATVSIVGTSKVVTIVLYSVVLISSFVDKSNIPLLLVASMYAPLLALNSWRPFTVIFVIVFVVLVPSLTKLELQRLCANRLVRASAFFVLLVIASLCYAPDFQVGLKYALEHAEALAFLCIVCAVLLANHCDATRFISALATIASVAVILCIIHTAFRDSMWLTRIYHENASAGEFPVESRYMLMYGSIPLTGRLILVGADPNYWAAQLFFPWGITIGLFRSSRRTSARLFWMICLAIISTGIIGTYSRSAFLVFAFLCLILILSTKGKGFVLFLCISAVAFLLIRELPFLAERILGIGGDIVGRGGSYRLSFWATAIENVTFGSLIVGNGIGSFLERYSVATHNTYLQIFYELGLPGLVTYLWIVFVGLKAWYRLLSSSCNSSSYTAGVLAHGCLVGFLGVLMQSATVSIHSDIVIYIPVIAGVAAYSQYEHAGRFKTR